MLFFISCLHGSMHALAVKLWHSKQDSQICADSHNHQLEKGLKPGVMVTRGVSELPNQLPFEMHAGSGISFCSNCTTAPAQQYLSGGCAECGKQHVRCQASRFCCSVQKQVHL